MMKKRKVLVPLDGSEFSRQIVRVVRSFFAPEDVSLVLFRAASAPTMPVEMAPHDVYVGGMAMTGGYEAYSRSLETTYDSVDRERELYRSELQDALRGDADRLRELGYTVAIEVNFGDPAQRIIDYVNEHDVDLVAMATHGRSGLGRIVLGSVAERVLRGVGVPVLLMRSASEGSEAATPGEMLVKSLGSGQGLNVAVATDGSVHGQRAVDLVTNLTHKIDMQVTLLVTASEQEGAAHAQQLMNDACKQIEGLEPRPEAVPLVGYADEELLQFVADHNVDVLVTGALHDKSAGSTTAIGPTVQRVVQYAPTSVLVTKGRIKPIQRVLACAAVDDAVAVDVAAQFASALDADLDLLHIVPPSAASYLATDSDNAIALRSVLTQGTRLSKVAERWVGRLHDQGYSRDVVTIRAGNVPETILEFAQEGDYDLIVVGSQSGPGRFLGSVANAVVRFADQSVLVVRTSTPG
jgi:nucleotide-binding universal stress UspA family protein